MTIKNSQDNSATLDIAQSDIEDMALIKQQIKELKSSVNGDIEKVSTEFAVNSNLEGLDAETKNAVTLKLLQINLENLQYKILSKVK